MLIVNDYDNDEDADDDDDDVDDGDGNGSKTPPYWTVTFYPNISNESEACQQYFRMEKKYISNKR